MKGGRSFMGYQKQGLLAGLTSSLLALSSCTSEPALSAGQSLIALEMTQVWLKEVQFWVVSDINMNTPVTVALVIPYNSGLLAKISGMTSVEFFAAIKQIQKDHPGSLDLHTWDIVPGHTPKPVRIHPTQSNGKGAFVFARYSTKGTHRASVGGATVLQISLDRTDFSVKKVR